VIQLISESNAVSIPNKLQKTLKNVAHKCGTLPSENRSSMLSEQQNGLAWKLRISPVSFTSWKQLPDYLVQKMRPLGSPVQTVQ